MVVASETQAGWEGKRMRSFGIGLGNVWTN